ncbi:hypothetical protein ACFLT7_08750 [candidate division KSB1 bacterium]
MALIANLFQKRFYPPAGTALLAVLMLVSVGGCSDDTIGPDYPVGPDRITLLGIYDSRNPAWANVIAYEYADDLWTVAPEDWDDTEPVTQRLIDLEGTETDPCWHPDTADSRLAFVHHQTDIYSIKILDTTDGEISTVYSNVEPIREPQWIYGDDKIAFIMHESGHYGVQLIDADGGEPTPIQKEKPWYPVVHHYCSQSKPIVWFVEQTGVENLFSITLDGGLALVQSSNGNSNNTFGGVAESADGSRLAISTLTYNLETDAWASALYQLKTHPPSPDWKDAVQLAINMPLSGGNVFLQWVSPNWSPAGDRIACGVRLDYWQDSQIRSKWDIAVIDLY